LPARRSFWLGVLALLLPVSLVAQEPQRLLLQMADAIEKLNYKGTLVYLQAGEAETFRVFHRVEGGQATEKVVALNGDGVEIIRTPSEVICVFPDKRRVVVEQRNSSKSELSLLRANLPKYTPSIASSYALRFIGEDRVANRTALLLAIDPADDYRYGYRLWLDSESSMPLKIELREIATDVPVEELFFTSISLLDSLRKELVEPTVDTDDFSWVRRGDTDDHLSAPLADIRWRAVSLPAGFMETAAKLEYLTEPSGPRTHLVYSDGLASVSVFVDVGVAASEQVEGLTSVGATNAYSLMVDGFLVTAMGEVPAQTVQLIATSMELQSASVTRFR
jgi:sigma-E factor negative regulatory protein RseB